MKKVPMLSKITLTNEDELFTCNVDEGLFEKKYPQLYETYKDQLKSMDRWEVEEILPDNDSIEGMIEKEEAVLLRFDNEETICIYNTELIDFNGLEFDGFSIHADSGFVYFIISIAGGQAGSLGIWGIADKNWIFTRRKDDFCVEAITYLPKANCFVGYSEWYHYGSQGSEYFFFINTNRNYLDIELEVAEAFDWTLLTLDESQNFFNQRDAALGFDQSQSAVIIIRGSERVAYRLGDAQIFALQGQATSQNKLT
jgi:hypothetical protein